jgi:dUTP pyrophosphatase
MGIGVKMKTDIKLLDERAKVPTRAHEADTGYDLTVIGVHKIVGDVIFFKTGIAVASPEGYYWEVVPCSRISKQGLSVANSFGVIDENYRGEVLVAIRVHHAHAGEGIGKSQQFATGLVEFENMRYRNLASLGEAIVRLKPVLTQLVLRRRYDSDFRVVDELNESERGDGGFGSSEKKKSETSRTKSVTGRTNASSRKAALTKKKTD